MVSVNLMSIVGLTEKILNLYRYFMQENLFNEETV